MPNHTFQNIKAWQKAHELVLCVYKFTHLFPRSEQYGLTSQLRRAVSSVATNIVEGYKRRSRKDFLHFLNMSESSLEETKYHLLLAKDLGYLKEVHFQEALEKAEETGRLLAGFQKYLLA